MRIDDALRRYNLLLPAISPYSLHRDDGVALVRPPYPATHRSDGPSQDSIHRAAITRSFSPLADSLIPIWPLSPRSYLRDAPTCAPYRVRTHQHTLTGLAAPDLTGTGQNYATRHSMPHWVITWLPMTTAQPWHSLCRPNPDSPLRLTRPLWASPTYSQATRQPIPCLGKSGLLTPRFTNATRHTLLCHPEPSPLEATQQPLQTPSGAAPTRQAKSAQASAICISSKRLPSPGQDALGHHVAS